MRVRTLVLCAMISITCRSEAFAARNVEVIQNPSLLMFGDVTQTVGLGYTFTEHATDHSSSTSNSFSERYNLITVAAVRDPDFINVQIDGGLNWQQAVTDKSSKYLDAQYHLVTSAFGTSNIPVTIVNSHDTSLVSDGYTPAYTLTRTVNQVTVSLLHQAVPLQISYGHNNSDSSGLSNDFSTTSDFAALTATHNYRDVSNTQLSLNFSSEASQGRNSRAYSLLLDNGINFDSAKRYILSSKVQLQDSKPVDAPQRDYNITEALSARFGAALIGTLAYQFTDSSSLDYGGANQDILTHSVTASLSHRLFASLASNVTGTYSKGDAYGGGTSSYGAAASLNYLKLLPAQSSLTVTLGGSRKITEQNIPVSQLTGRDERHHVVAQGDFIRPNLQGTLVSVESVRSLNPDVTYVEGIDYRVDLVQDRIEILTGGGIAPGTDLLISYTVSIDSSIKYASNAYNAGSVVTLFNGRYTLGADLAVVDDQVLSGVDSNSSLNHSTNFSMRADARYGTATFGVDYANSENSSQNFSKVGAHLNYAHQLSRTDNFSFNLRDDYFMYPKSSTSSGYNENSFSASGGYGCRLFDFLRMSTMVGFNDSQSRYGSGDTFSLHLSLDADYRRLTFSLNAISMYRFTGSTSNRDSTITLMTTRSF